MVSIKYTYKKIEGEILFCFQKSELESIFIGVFIAPLAQLDRASGFEPEGWRFESVRAQFFNPAKMP